MDTNGDGRLAIVPRPRGGDWLEEELLAIKAAGVDVLVSLLTRDEEIELGLAREAELCERVGLTFRSFPIADRSTPESLRAFHEFVSALRRDMETGNSVATHCRASIGRAALTIAALMSAKGQTTEEVFKGIATARGTGVPDTREQVLWVERFAEYTRAQI